ncbi:uncharacterized protein ARB_05402 [Trichophyton benhamiae CBS 112371]|uniref:Uncharacterized protein n=1 Tax=Arthroderma benhamiae (strain ATCC MYA-4681 / CBS 112371) TaxID=663331 RepID=D4AME9_ARTBC|nr:uncharacterized protein ARB_05402 [Trichophyton benhamiae CBS 112371]EFE35360.1 hypothetical protein ARB_05402 [Trichophyton benhamiae CBS 112371]
MEAAKGSESPRRSRSRWLCLKGGCSVPRIVSMHSTPKQRARSQTPKARAADQKRVQRTGAGKRSASEIYTEIRELDGVKGPPQIVMSPSTLWALAASTCHIYYGHRLPIINANINPTAVSEASEASEATDADQRPWLAWPYEACGGASPHLGLPFYPFFLLFCFFPSFLFWLFSSPFLLQISTLNYKLLSIENICGVCGSARAMGIRLSQLPREQRRKRSLLGPSPGRFFGSEAEPDDADEPFGNMVREGLQYGEQGRSGEAGEQIVANQTLRAKFDLTITRWLNYGKNHSRTLYSVRCLYHPVFPGAGAGASHIIILRLGRIEMENPSFSALFTPELSLFLLCLSPIGSFDAYDEAAAAAAAVQVVPGTTPLMYLPTPPPPPPPPPLPPPASPRFTLSLLSSSLDPRHSRPLYTRNQGL